MDRFEAERKLRHWGVLLREENSRYSSIADKLGLIADEMHTPPIGRRRSEVYEAAKLLGSLGEKIIAAKLVQLAASEMRAYRL
ncbi:hypothetical protein [Phyllobacterium sp. K27]